MQRFTFIEPKGSLEALVEQESRVKSEPIDPEEFRLWKDLADLGITDERIATATGLNDEIKHQEVSCRKCKVLFDLILQTVGYSLYWRLECPRCHYKPWMYNYSLHKDRYYYTEVKPRITPDTLIERHLYGGE